METNPTALVDSLISPGTNAAFAGAVLLTVLIIVRRVVNGRLKPVWGRFFEKVAAVIAAAASGLIATPQDSLEGILRPILTAVIVVGLSVGLYRYIGDLIFARKAEDAEGKAGLLSTR